MHPQRASRARALELGGATGGHRIPLARYNAKAEFTGVELSQEQDNTGRRLINAMNLENCQLECADLSDWPGAAESYDCIIAHGLYAWIHPQLRDVMLNLLRRMSKQNGVAYISYNTLPG